MTPRLTSNYCRFKAKYLPSGQTATSLQSMKQIASSYWIFLRLRAQGHSGEIGFWSVIGGVVLLAVYFAYPEPFHLFVSKFIHELLQIVNDSFSGGKTGSPDKDVQVK